MSGASNHKLVPVGYIASTGKASTRSALDQISASITVNGTLTITGGLYTTNGNNSTDKVLMGTGKIIHTPSKTASTIYEAENYYDTSGWVDLWQVQTTGISVSTVLGNLAGVGDMQSFATGTYYGQSDNYWYQHIINTNIGNIITGSTGTTLSPMDAREVDNIVGLVANGGAITFTAAEGYDVYIGEELQTATDGTYTLSNVSADTTITLSPVSVRLSAIDLALQDEILFTYKVYLPKNAVTIILTKPDPWTEGKTNSEEYTVSELEPDDKGRYEVTMGIASGEMTRDIKLTVLDAEGNPISIVKHSDGLLIGKAANYSVLDYAGLVYEGDDAAKKEMVKALLTYGGYAQVYFGVDEENPAYNTLKDNLGTDVPPLDKYTSDTVTNTITADGDSIGITATAYNPCLDSALSFRLFFVLTEGESIDNYTFTLTRPNDSTAYKLDALPEESTGRYYVDVTDIPSGYLNDDYTITVTKTGIEGKYVVTVSMLDWSRRILNRDSATDVQKDMARALCLYSEAADTYFGKQ